MTSTTTANPTPPNPTPPHPAAPNPTATGLAAPRHQVAAAAVHCSGRAMVDGLRHELGELVCLVELARDVIVTATRTGAAGPAHSMHPTRVGTLEDNMLEVEVVMERCGPIEVLVAGLDQRYGASHPTRTHIRAGRAWQVDGRNVAFSAYSNLWRFLVSSSQQSGLERRTHLGW